MPGDELTPQPAPGLESPLAAAVAARDRDILNTVRSALSRKQVLLAYQPVITARDMRSVAFYEGLIRVLDESGRIIPAREFIDVVETQELGRVLDSLALEKGLQALRDDPSLRLSINMSARSIGYQRWQQILEEGLRQNPCVAERLILEVAEQSVMLMPELVSSFMADQQQRGIAFALDDFGAGYTAFRFFKDFCFDAVKIDGQFIRGIDRDPDNQALTRALLSIAGHFEMFAVAETVETIEEAQYLQSIGLDCLQGYLFGAPSVRSPSEQVAARSAG